MNKDWWKWGNPVESKHLNDYPTARTFLENRWKITLKEDFKPPNRFNIDTLSEKTIKNIKSIFPSIAQEKISFNVDDRLQVALGKSYYDSIRICKNDHIIAPDFVFSPATKEEIEYFIEQASKNNIKVVPFGGGSNVVGALTLEKEEGLKCSINLKNLDQLINIDEAHRTATFQAGIFGPDLEDILNKKGYTLGHFPQSFEYSTLGGWVVTRSAGQESSYYGKIEDLIERLCVVTPIGTLYSNEYSHDASGINLLSLFVGSEGILGIVTEVTVKIKKLPADYHWLVALFPDFEAGTNYLQELAQAEIKPSIVRLSDANETLLFSKLSNSDNEDGNFLDNIKKRVQKFILTQKNLTKPCVLIMRFVQSNHDNASAQVTFSKKLVVKYKGMLAPAKIGASWAENRYKTPYLRDTFIEHRILIDTMETLVHWKDIRKLHKDLTDKLNQSEAFGKEKGIFLAHISHIYPNAACMYFTLLTPMKKGNEIEQWQEIKNLVTNTIKDNDGAISHHHSIGSDHKKWYLKYSDPVTLVILKQIKEKVDPNNILNPGKLFS